MANLTHSVLDDRGVLSVTGEDARSFLQGLVSNDMDKVAADRAMWAAFLTPQGKFLHDFFVVQVAHGENGEGTAFLLDCEGGRRDDLRRRLRMYRLRSKADVTDVTDAMTVAAVFRPAEAAAEAFGVPGTAGAARNLAGGAAYVDPRLAAAGVRLIGETAEVAAALDHRDSEAAEAAEYDRHRLDLALPDGSRDMVVERALLLECGFEEMHGVDFQKGCYLGQELTARTKYRGLLKRRLFSVRIDGPAPEPGTPVLMDGRDAGEMRSSDGTRGLAVLRLDALERGGGTSVDLIAGEALLTPRPAPWSRHGLDGGDDAAGKGTATS